MNEKLINAISDLIERQECEAAATLFLNNVDSLNIDQQLQFGEDITNLCVVQESYESAYLVGSWTLEKMKPNSHILDIIQSLIQLGAVESVLGKHKEALNHFEEAIRLQPEAAIDNEAHCYAGTEALFLEDFPLALEHLSHPFPADLDAKEWIRINTLKGDTFARLGEMANAGATYTESFQRSLNLPKSEQITIAQSLAEKVKWLMMYRDKGV